MNISSISRAAFPVAASALIGLGALTSCSSKYDKSGEDYYQNMTMQTDKTLDSLKTLKDNNTIDFVDYYVKSQNVISEIEPVKQTDTKENNLSNALGIFGLFTFAFGTAASAAATVKKVNKSMLNKVSISALVTGALMVIASGFMKTGIMDKISDMNPKIEQYKKIKMDQLNIDKTKYLNNQKEP